MVHASKLSTTYSASEWKPAHYILQDPVAFGAEQIVHAILINQGKQEEVSLHILEGAFWSCDSFKSNEKIVVLEQKNSEAEVKQVCLVVSHKFFVDMLRPCPSSALSKLTRIPAMATLEQLLFAAYVIGSSGAKNTNEGSSEKLNPERVSGFYHMVREYLLPEQQVGCDFWLSNPSSKNKEKLQKVLQAPPASPWRNHEEITFDSIMEVLDQEIVGNNDLKYSIASFFADKMKQDKKRGAVILIYGLAGTGKTKFAKVLAKALRLAVKQIDLGNISSKLSIVGSESAYNDSEPGNPFKFIVAQKNSEVEIIFDEVDKLGRIGTDRGKDGEVIETLLKLMDSSCPALCDVFVDGIPVDCSNTVFVLTANRIDNIPPELLDRCDIKCQLMPMPEDVLLEIINRESEKIALTRHLSRTWITEGAKETILQYRSDFGARDVIRLTRALSRLSVEGNDVQPVSSEIAKEELERITDMNSPVVRFHRNENCYPAAQREAILDTFSRAQSCSNLDDHEKRILDLKLDYLTRMVPDGPHHFDKDAFCDYCEKAVYGCNKQKNLIAGEYYSAEFIGSKPGRILFVGPPGVGKSSLAEAAAVASGRKYVRCQMNGANDIAMIRGTLPVIAGSDAGIIGKNLAKAESTEPVLFLDEIDKMSHDAQLALLDVLDDSGRFYDNFFEIWSDISNAYIIGSANDLSAIEPALLSRFMIVEMPGYSAMEKKVIAENYLLPKIIQNADIHFEPGAFESILARYESDAGVRELKHSLETVVKQCILKHSDSSSVTIFKSDIEEILGRAPYIYAADRVPGSVNGLATYGSSHGIVMPIRVTLLHNGVRRITGLPEESIRDSISIAETWLEETHGFRIEDGFHIHFSPAGIKKDGPSAGVAIAIAILSAVSDTPIENMAFTGEFDGRNVLPVGGISLKVQAAQSAGIHTVYIPAGCRGDIQDSNYDIEIRYVSTIEEIVNDILPHVNHDNMMMNK